MLQESAIDRADVKSNTAVTTFTFGLLKVCRQLIECSSAGSRQTQHEIFFFLLRKIAKINYTRAYYKLLVFLKDSVPLFMQTIVGLSVVSDEQKILSLSFDE